MIFPSSGVFVIWKWKQPVEMSAPDLEASPPASPTLFEDSQLIDEYYNEYDSDPEDATELVPHSLVFKCIGCNKSQDYQRALKDARDCLSVGVEVPVCIEHEPTNPKDARALAFVCQIHGKSHKIGYIVAELVDEVHTAINENKINSVKFSWIRYITDWSVSGPGYFAGIEITKKGAWSVTAVGSASTR